MRVELAWILAAICLVMAATLTGWQRRRALRTGMLDVPNQRSSHAQPTPRGGGLAIVVTIAIVSGLLLRFAPESRALIVAVMPGFLVVALVGWLDDRSGLAPRVRLVAHVFGSLWAVWCLARAPGSWLAASDTWMIIAMGALLVLAITWATNLFNFMDGIDGIAGSQAVFTGVMGACLCWLSGDGTSATFMLAISASCAGFLYWNWPPARIFMGDVGSGALGFLLAAAPLLIATIGISRLVPWAILWGAFVADASVTLVRRALRRERLSVAHRSHAYQRLSRRWGSHRRVTVAFALVNCLWLAPLSLVAWRWPAFCLAILALAWVPLVVVAVLLGAGKHES
jgi:Fuc2NAc and GlcNAc transferase